MRNKIILVWGPSHIVDTEWLFSKGLDPNRPVLPPSKTGVPYQKKENRKARKA